MRWGGIIVLFVLAAFFALLGFGNDLQVDEARALSANGAATEGTVTAQHARKRGGVYRYSYAYRVDGREVVAEQRTITYAAGGLPVGARLAVRYDPADPGKSITPAELEELENWANRAFLPVVSFALLAWAVVLIVRRRRRTT